MSDPAAVWINFNGESYPSGSAVLTVSNRGFRYGDGVFETMLVQDGRIRLEQYHFVRLWTEMKFLDFQRPCTFTDKYLRDQILALCKKNGHSGLGRVRLTVFRGEGTLFDTVSNEPHFVIESAPLTPREIAFNESGLRIGVYPDGCKACDFLAIIKSNNFLLYTVAARYAHAHGWDDCVVLNNHARVAETCIANLFYVHQGIVYTPPFTEGCVGGVMRRFLLERLADQGIPFEERSVTVKDLRGADEIFLTNALRTIRWVGEFEGKTYRGKIAHELYDTVTIGV